MRTHGPTGRVCALISAHAPLPRRACAQVPLTASLRRRKLPPKYVDLHVLVRAPDGTTLPLEQTALPQPVLRGPTFGSLSEEIRADAEASPPDSAAGQVQTRTDSTQMMSLNGP